MKKKNFYCHLLIVFSVILGLAACNPPDPIEDNEILRQDNTTIGNPRTDDATDAALDTTLQLTISYVDNEIVKSPATVGQSNGSELYDQSAAVKFEARQLAALDGNRIIKLAAVISTKTDDYSNLVFWIRESLDGQNVWSCEHKGNITPGEWTEIIAAPYFKLSRSNVKDLYFGYTVKANKLPIAGDGSGMPNANASYIYDNSSASWIEYPALGNIYIRATVSGNNMPANDMELLYVRTPEFVKKGEKFDIIAEVRNKASEVKSFRIIAKNGNDVYAEKVVDLEKPLARGEQAIVFVENMDIKTTGTKEIEYKIDMVNGKNDDNYDDNSLKVTTDISDRFKKRVVLLENFTGQGCKGCPGGHDNLAGIMEQTNSRDDFAWVCHHAGFNPDELSIPQSTDSALTFYNSTMTYAPALVLDRRSYGDIGAVTSSMSGYTAASGPVMDLGRHYVTGTLAGYMNYARKIAAPIDLKVNYSFDNDSRMLNVSAEIEKLSSLVDDKNLAIGVAVLENGIVAGQTMSDGKINKNYVHNSVVRDYFTSVFARRIEGNLSFSTSKTINANCNVENMELVVWVANRPKPFDLYENYNDCFVYQTFIGKIIK